MNLNHQLAKFRLDAGLSVDDLANKAGIRKDQLMKLEHGCRDLPLFVQDAVIKVLNKRLRPVEH